MLWVHGNYKYLNSFSVGIVVIGLRQNLTLCEWLVSREGVCNLQGRYGSDPNDPANARCSSNVDLLLCNTTVNQHWINVRFYLERTATENIMNRSACQTSTQNNVVMVPLPRVGGMTLMVWLTLKKQYVSPP